MNRRDFLKGTAGFTAASLIPARVLSKNIYPDLAVSRDGTPVALLREAVQALGGMSRFVTKGDIVVLKPNISWDRVPEQGATTNPEIVAEIVKLCFEAGAKKVKIFDNTLNEPRRCYLRSGIEKAAKEAGADVFHVYERKFKNTDFPEGELIKSWPVYDEVLEADCLINVPVAKHHNVSEALVSMSLKNLMGLIGGNRGKFHRDFSIKISDLGARIRPKLVILDAYRMLIRNGPSGGNPDDVELRKTVVAGCDPVAVDSYGATLFGHDPLRLGYLIEAKKRGLGENDLGKLNIKTIALS